MLTCGRHPSIVSHGAHWHWVPAVLVLIASLVHAPLQAVALDVAADAMPARGVVRPISQATIATDLQARVAAIGVKEGEHFKAGDLLVEFDCRRYRAELASAEAQRREAELLLDNNMVLNQHRAIGKHEVEISRARLERAAGDLEALKARIDDCRLVAPFDGRVANLAIHRHEDSDQRQAIHHHYQ